MRQPRTCARCDQPILKGQPFTTAIVPGRSPHPGPGSQERRGLQNARRGSAKDAVELDGDHAFGDCGSRRPWRVAPKNPCHMRGNPSTEAGRGTSGCYVERPARVDSTSLAEAPASRAGVRAAMDAALRPGRGDRIVGDESGPTPPSSGGHGDLLQEFKFIENPPDPQGHAGHRVLGDRHRKLGFLPEQPVQPA